MSKDTYLLEIEWDKPGLPSLVGPFDTRDEAKGWASLNIPNGSWNVAPLSYPYAASPPERERLRASVAAACRREQEAEGN